MNNQKDICDECKKVSHRCFISIYASKPIIKCKYFEEDLQVKNNTSVVKDRREVL